MGQWIVRAAPGQRLVRAAGTTPRVSPAGAAGPRGATGATGADGGSDAVTADRVANGPLTSAALSATYARLRNETPFAPLMAALREGVDDVAIGLVGDSTGDATDEWLYRVGQWLAPLFPAYTVQHRVWADATQRFSAPTTLQTGTGGVQRAAVMAASGAFPVRTPGVSTITGDLDIRVYCKPTSWHTGSTQTFASKFGSGGANVDRAFRFQVNGTGLLTFDWSTDGAALQSAANSTAAVPFADGTAGWVRVTLDVDNGSGGHAISYYTSTDGQTWTQLGTTITRATGVTSIAPATGWPFELGARQGGSEPMNGGRIYEAEIRDGIDGPTVCPRLPTLWSRISGSGYSSIEGPPVLTLVNGSMPGAGLTYLNETTRVKKMVPGFGQAVQFFADSHNETATVGESWTTSYASWVSNVLARLPMANPVVLTQNPRYSPATFIDTHAQRRRQIMGWARQKGYPVIDTYQALLDDGRGSALINTDGIHPTQVANGGQQVWTNAITALMV